MSDDPFRGVVNATVVYDKVVQVGEAVRAVETKIDQAAASLGEIRDVQRDHETRLRAVEGERWPHGKLTLVVAMAGVVVAVLALVVKAL